MKIAITGYSGSGRSLPANHPGGRSGLPVLYLGKVEFVENWKHRDPGEAGAIDFDVLRQNSWIISGSCGAVYLAQRPEAADQIVFPAGPPAAGKVVP